MFDRILLPLDGSEVAEAAIPVAAMIPAQEILLLYVAPECAAGSGVNLMTRTFEARSYLDPIARQFRQAGRRVDVDVEFGEPAELIVDTARRSDLIVMATDARGIGGRVIGGCACDKVARHAPAPTLLVRAGRHGIAAMPLSRLVVPLDGSAAAEAALRPAWRMAALIGSTVHLIHVLDPATPLGGDRQQAEAYLRGIARRAETGAHLTWDIREGEAAMAIASAATPGDLLVLTTHGAGGITRWFLGSVAERLIRHAPVPVLVAREAVPDALIMTATDAAAPAWW